METTTKIEEEIEEIEQIKARVESQIRIFEPIERIVHVNSLKRWFFLLWENRHFDNILLLTLTDFVLFLFDTSKSFSAPVLCGKSIEIISSKWKIEAFIKQRMSIIKVDDWIVY